MGLTPPDLAGNYSLRVNDTGRSNQNQWIRKWITSFQNTQVFTKEGRERNGWGLEGRARTRFSWSQRVWDLAIAITALPQGGVREMCLGGALQLCQPVIFFLFPLLLCPWMPHENFRISLVETVCERTARSLFSYIKTEQCACVQEGVCLRVVWGNGKKTQPMFAREEVDTTIWFSAFHKTELLVAVGLCFWSLTEETRLGLASGLLVYF